MSIGSLINDYNIIRGEEVVFGPNSGDNIWPTITSGNSRTAGIIPSTPSYLLGPSIKEDWEDKECRLIEEREFLLSKTKRLWEQIREVGIEVYSVEKELSGLYGNKDEEEGEAV